MIFIYRCYRGIRVKTKRTASILSIVLIGLLLAALLHSGFRLGDEAPRRMLADSVDWLVCKVFQDPKGMVLASMPALSWQDTPEEMESPGRALLSWLAGITRIDLNPAGMLRAQIPLLGQISPPEVSVVAMDPAIPEDPQLEQKVSQEVLVGIYTTHTGETYSLTDGTDRLTGEQGGVVKVARAVQKTLEDKHAIRVVLSDRVHDARYATSYLESKKTATEMAEKNPHMIAMLDIHRDAGRSREESLVEVKGQKIAPILIIIGSDARLPFPNWKQNYRFACRLAAKINELYPGLCLGVRVKEGRYNQFLHPGAVLLEIGTDNNSLEEAVASGEMLADALAKLVQEEVKTRETLKKEENIPGKTQDEQTIDPEAEEENRYEERHAQPVPPFHPKESVH
ncbi:MAG: stage II sporulation protein P [Firmicutes bacterium]|nr:stage II sporulation protein P [Bacillota bacterium]